MVDYRNYESNGVKFYKSLDIKDIKIIKKYTPNPKVFIEFGSYDAGDGVFLKKNFPDTKVYSIEACPERYSVIKKIEKLFDLNVFNYSVYDNDGVIDFYQVQDPNVMDHDKKYGSSGSINKKTNFYKKTYDHIEELNSISVPSIRIDTFCKNNKIDSIDYMHIDTEGAEFKVLSGFGIIRPKILRLENCYGKKYYGEFAYEENELVNILSSMNYKKIEEGSTESDVLYVYEN
jgi:FkbM family methyltransferase